MKKITYILCLTAFVAFIFLTTPLLAANYKFTVDKNHSEIYINDNGSIDIEYLLTFTTASGAKAIDIVDIGLPNHNYDLSSAMADIDGQTINNINKSTYISIGVEIPLGHNEIKPQQTKTLHFKVNNSKMVFEDDMDEKFVSVEFYPTYFDSSITYGNTDLKTSFHMPDGVTEEMIVTRHDANVSFSRDSNDRLVVTWSKPDASPSTQYKFGVSFPKQFVTTAFPAGEYTPSTGYTTYTPSSFDLSGFGECIIIFVILFIIAIFENIRRSLSKNKYLPPSATVEGFGPNKNLTPAEIGLLSELPLSRICSIIITQLLQKGAIEDIDYEYKIKQMNKTPEIFNNLNLYEKEFTKILSKSNHYQAPSKAKLKDFFIDLVEDTVDKMEKFSRVDTKNYYLNIVKEIWDEMENCYVNGDNFSLRKISDILDINFALLMTDKKFSTKIKPYLAHTDIPKPQWLRKLKELKDEHNKIVKKINLEGELDEEYYEEDYVEYYIDFFDSYDYFDSFRFNDIALDVVKNTNPAAVATSSSSYGGGGGCACACACACAGGGR